MKHVLSIVCNHLCALGPRFFSCSTSMSSMPAALLFLNAAIPFLYYSSLNADTNDDFLDSLPCLATVMSRINRCDDLSHLFFFSSFIVSIN